MDTFIPVGSLFFGLFLKLATTSALYGIVSALPAVGHGICGFCYRCAHLRDLPVIYISFKMPYALFDLCFCLLQIQDVLPGFLNQLLFDLSL